NAQPATGAPSTTKVKSTAQNGDTAGNGKRARAREALAWVGAQSLAMPASLGCLSGCLLGCLTLMVLLTAGAFFLVILLSTTPISFLTTFLTNANTTLNGNVNANANGTANLNGNANLNTN